MACIFVLSSEHKLQIMIMDTLNPLYISSQIFLVKNCTTLASVKNCVLSSSDWFRVKWIFGGQNPLYAKPIRGGEELRVLRFSEGHF